MEQCFGNLRTSRLGTNLWLDIRDLQLYKTVSPEYIREVSCIIYKIENYNDKTKYKTKDTNYERLKDTWL